MKIDVRIGSIAVSGVTVSYSHVLHLAVIAIETPGSLHPAVRCSKEIDSIGIFRIIVDLHDAATPGNPTSVSLYAASPTERALLDSNLHEIPGDHWSVRLLAINLEEIFSREEANLRTTQWTAPEPIPDVPRLY